MIEKIVDKVWNDERVFENAKTTKYKGLYEVGKYKKRFGEGRLLYSTATHYFYYEIRKLMQPVSLSDEFHLEYLAFGPRPHHLEK